MHCAAMPHVLFTYQAAACKNTCYYGKPNHSTHMYAVLHPHNTTEQYPTTRKSSRRVLDIRDMPCMSLLLPQPPNQGDSCASE